MDTIEYDKLVRDKIPEVIEKTGSTYVIHVADEEEYKSRLTKKLIEEATEFMENPCEEEYADVLEVLECIKSAFNYNLNIINKIKEQKTIERGSFKDRIILESVTKK